MYLWVVAIELCPASSASTRTETDGLARELVMNVRRPLCELAPLMPHLLSMLRKSWHIVFGLNALFFQS
jgi:hypothetical protein